MADDDGNSGEQTPAEKAGEAVEAVEKKIETVQADANSAVARAQADVDAANEESKRIAAAAIATDLGAQIQSTRQEFTTWSQTQAQELAELKSRTAAQETQLGELKTGLGLILGALKPASLLPSTPLKSEPPAEGTPEAAHKANPGESADAPQDKKPPAPTSRKRVLL